ncbi:hypothetical protein CPB85DRAFT_1312360 [Mucidula mucida]|nr:hypothetical protein CPB85DRAFT_1312360 [Mucidula mucida]
MRLASRTSCPPTFFVTIKRCKKSPSHKWWMKRRFVCWRRISPYSNRANDAYRMIQQPLNGSFRRQSPNRRVYAPPSRLINPLLTRSPVRALPGEVLSEILLHYIALSQSRQRTVFREIVASYRTHSLILQVCRRWRATALADPRLWTTIPLIGSGEDFDDDEEEEDSFAHPMITGSPQERAAYWKALEKTLHQTSSLPLQILLHFNARGSIGNPDDAISSLQTFVRVFPRANSISLDVYCPQYSTPEFRSVMKDLEIPRADRVHTARIMAFDEVFERKFLSAIPNVEVLEVRSWKVVH